MNSAVYLYIFYSNSHLCIYPNALLNTITAIVGVFSVVLTAKGKLSNFYHRTNIADSALSRTMDIVGSFQLNILTCALWLEIWLEQGNASLASLLMFLMYFLVSIYGYFYWTQLVNKVTIESRS